MYVRSVVLGKGTGGRRIVRLGVVGGLVWRRLSGYGVERRELDFEKFFMIR